MKTIIESKGDLGDVKVTRHSPERLFADGTAEMIVHWLREEHPGDKAGAMSALMFYMNRAGENLSEERRGVLNHAKGLLQEGDHREKDGGKPKKKHHKKDESTFTPGNPGGKIGGMKTTSSIRTNNDGYGFHGEAGAAGQDADAAFAKAADHLVAKKHFPTHDAARDFLDSTHGRHLHDELTHHTEDSDLSKMPDEDLTRAVLTYKKRLRSRSASRVVKADDQESTSGTFVLSVNIGNAAFQDGCGAELARLLREVAQDIEDADVNSIHGSLRDHNGNKVGSYTINDLSYSSVAIQAAISIGKPKDPQALAAAVKQWLAFRGKASVGDAALKQVLVDQGVITQEQADSAYVEGGAREHGLAHVFLADDSEDGGEWLEVLPNGGVDLV